MQGPTTTNLPQHLPNMAHKPCCTMPQPQPLRLQLLHHTSPPCTSPTILPPQHSVQAPPLLPYRNPGSIATSTMSFHHHTSSPHTSPKVPPTCCNPTPTWQASPTLQPCPSHPSLLPPL